MSCTTGRVNQVQIAAHPARATLFVSLELSKSKWLATVLLPGGDKMSKHTVLGGDWDALLALLLRARARAEARVGKSVQIVAIHEAGLDGFSVHRVLQMNGVESHVVDPASIAVPRRKRRAKSVSGRRFSVRLCHENPSGVKKSPDRGFGQAAAVALCQACIASALKVRSVRRET